jgi:hypothetical protein
MFLAREAEIILRSAAKVGIIGLIDEAVGFVDKPRTSTGTYFSSS